jgi:Na+-driven multidrug efflux pump
MALGGALRGGGDALSPLIFTVATQLVLGIGAGALVVLIGGYGPIGLWVSIVAAMYLQAVVTIWWFRRGRWKTLEV